MKTRISTAQELADIQIKMNEAFLAGHKIEVDIVRKKRTLPQNRAIHLYCTLLATKLNDAGYDMRRTLKADIDIPWSPDTIKKHIWHKVQLAMLGFESTAQLSTAQVSEVYKVISRHLSQSTGVNQEFPNYEKRD